MQANTEAEESTCDCCDNAYKAEYRVCEARKALNGERLLKSCYGRLLGSIAARN